MSPWSTSSRASTRRSIHHSSGSTSAALSRGAFSTTAAASRELLGAPQISGFGEEIAGRALRGRHRVEQLAGLLVAAQHRRPGIGELLGAGQRRQRAAPISGARHRACAPCGSGGRQSEWTAPNSLMMAASSAASSFSVRQNGDSTARAASGCPSARCARARIVTPWIVCGSRLAERLDHDLRIGVLAIERAFAVAAQRLGAGPLRENLRGLGDLAARHACLAAHGDRPGQDVPVERIVTAAARDTRARRRCRRRPARRAPP